MKSSATASEAWDFVIIGSGFGGSVTALRLVEKGYRVLMLERGRRLGAKDFPKTNWDLKRWMWAPLLGWRGLFRMTFLPHVTVLSGVGVGGGSLVYANTLPIPGDGFFSASSWSHLLPWKSTLKPHYAEARRMLGATRNPLPTPADAVLADVAKDIGRADEHQSTMVSVYFGEEGKTVTDPYFGGEGPDRTGCRACGGCLLGCRYDAKNTLDKNYLYLAENRGLTILPDMEATWVKPDGQGGYEISALEGARLFGRKKRQFRAKQVVFAGGVLGTVPLLLKLRQSAAGLPRLSKRLGDFVRTNSESLIGVVSRKKDVDYSTGVAITSILHTDEHSHIEPVRYPRGSSFFRLLTLPHVGPGPFFARVGRLVKTMVTQPIKTLKTLFVDDLAKRSMILLYMRSLEGHMRMRLGRPWTQGFMRGLTTSITEGPRPAAALPEATDLAKRVGEKIDGQPTSMVSETLFDIPTTAHILGGCCMGETADDGVIDAQHRVHGYEGLYVIDGSSISANPGVNPSLTICALAEHAMSHVPAKASEPAENARKCA